MAFTLNQFKALSSKKETVEATIKTSGSKLDQFISSTRTTAKSTGSFVGNVMPATRGSVKNLAAELNTKYNNHEKELFKQNIKLEMIAQAAGVNLPEEEILDEYYEAHLEEQAVQAKAAKVVEKAQETTVTPHDLLEGLSAVFQQMISAVAPKAPEKVEEEEPIVGNGEEDEIPVDEDELLEYRRQLAQKKIEEAVRKAEEQEEEQPRKGGRRRLGRQAPMEGTAE